MNYPVAYEGVEPYVFISYAHKDSDRVLPLIQGLMDRGFRVWYDGGIEVGTEWPTYIATHIKLSHCFLAFITQAALESPSCRREINYAISKNRNTIAVHLEDVVLDDGMEMQLNSFQKAFLDRYPHTDTMLDALGKAAYLLPCGTFSAQDASDEGQHRPNAEKLHRYIFGDEIEITAGSFEEAWDAFTATAQDGHAPAQHLLGYFYGSGKHVAENKEAAVKWYRLAADQGHADAQYSLGGCYHVGEGVPQDYEEAANWYRLAAEQGHVFAQYDLGWSYYFGEGVPENHDKAVKWYRLAAEQGYDFAQTNLGNCYLWGHGVEKDPGEAVKWYRLAAEQKNFTAQYNLGICYHNGDGVSQDEVEAVKWYQLSADQGYAEAQYHLGICYEKGQGVPQDDELAAKWYRLAAEQDYDLAQSELGKFYEHGFGVLQSYDKAIYWYSRAYGNGDTEVYMNILACKVKRWIQKYLISEVEE